MGQSMKMLAAHAWQPELLPQQPHKGRQKNQLHKMCLLTPKWQAQIHRYTQLKYVNKMIYR